MWCAGCGVVVVAMKAVVAVVPVEAVVVVVGGQVAVADAVFVIVRVL